MGRITRRELPGDDTKELSGALASWALAGLLLTPGATFGAGVHVEVRAVLREHLKNPEFSLERKPEYVITDPAFIEPVLDQALEYVDLSPPLSRAKLGQVKQSAETYYRLDQRKPAGLQCRAGKIRKIPFERSLPAFGLQSPLVRGDLSLTALREIAIRLLRLLRNPADSKLRPEAFRFPWHV